MNERKGGMPGIRGMDHVGLTVPDIDQAIDFFVNVLGGEAFYELGPFQNDGDWMTTHMGVNPRTVMRRLKFVRCGHGSNFELFQYEAKDQKRQQPLNSDIGGFHLAFYVDDIDAAVRHLKANGVRVMGEPTVRDTGPSAGQTWVYFLTPWGLQMELVSFPDGKGYERETTARLWHPAHPER